jgi:hypothetical protein
MTILFLDCLPQNTNKMQRIILTNNILFSTQHVKPQQKKIIQYNVMLMYHFTINHMDKWIKIEKRAVEK